MKDGEMTDAELVRSSLEGDMESYKTLMNRHRGGAMAVALNMLMNYEDAEDACQDAYLKAFQNLVRFDCRRSFKNWFYALVSNLCLDRIRKKRRFFKFLGRLKSEEMTAAGSPPRPVSHAGLIDLKRLRCLSPRERTALYLWAQEGCSGSEIAEALGCSEKTAHVYLFKARTKLKAFLREEKNGSL
jgi:RNA polymerase sigma-70 factor (ECF subfamily)